MLLRNITSATAGDPSPFRRFYGMDYDPSGLLPFGARVSFANKNASKSKLADKGMVGRYLGIAPFHTQNAGMVLRPTGHVGAQRGLRLLEEPNSQDTADSNSEGTGGLGGIEMEIPAQSTHIGDKIARNF